MKDLNELLTRQAEINDVLGQMSGREISAEEKATYDVLTREFEQNKREIITIKQTREASMMEPAKKQTIVGQIREAVKLNKRSITVQGYGSGETAVAGVHGDVIETEMQGLLEPLYAKSALAELGVRWYKGLPMGDIQVPIMGKGQVGWKGEIGSADASQNAFNHKTLTPHRLTAKVAISKQLLAQDNVGAEEAIKRDLVNAIADKLEATVFGAAAGETGVQPAGMFNGHDLEDGTTFVKICGIEAGIEAANVTGNVKYLLAPATKADLRGMATNGAGSKRVFEGGDVDGVPAIVTSNVAAGKFIYGDFSNLAVASWGDIEIVVDPYTLAADGCIQLTVNSYFDAQVLRAEAFAYGKTRASV